MKEDKVFKIGDKVQYNTPTFFKEGTVVQIIPAKECPTKEKWRYYQDDKYSTNYVVAFEDGSETLVYWKLSNIDSEIEREFRISYYAVINQIEEKVKEASRLLTEATQIAELHGIPFHSPISELGQSYTPISLKEKFGDLTPDFIEGITGAYPDSYTTGWQHSQVC